MLLSPIGRNSQPQVRADRAETEPNNCHPERSEGPFISTPKKGPSLRSG